MMLNEKKTNKKLSYTELYFCLSLSFLRDHYLEVEILTKKDKILQIDMKSNLIKNSNGSELW